MRLPPHTIHTNAARGFTLIELLVVVTIIVVLLSLLTPALDKAIYQAELTACGARLKGHATGAVLYTSDFRRSYPHRPAIETFSTPWRHDYLAYTANPANDDRPPIRPYMAINKTAACPFVQELDFDGAPAEGNTLPAVLLATSYQRFYGFRYYHSGRGMLRLGDRLQWKEGANGTPEGFSVLAADTDLADYGNSYSNAAHPDRGVFFSLITVDNVLYAPNQAYESYSYWGRYNAVPARGPLDRSFAFDDNSVRTVTDLKLADPRLTRVGAHSFAQDSATYATWLPNR